jgi:hypothetical protein
MALARSRIGTTSMAPAPGSIATSSVAAARGSIGTGGVAPPVAAAAAATVSAATAIICQRDVAGHQMTVDQCDRGSGQRRTNDRGSHEPPQPVW